MFSSLPVVLPKGSGANYTYTIVGWCVWIVAKNREEVFKKSDFFLKSHHVIKKKKKLVSCSGL